MAYLNYTYKFSLVLTGKFLFFKLADIWRKNWKQKSVHFNVLQEKVKYSFQNLCSVDLASYVLFFTVYADICNKYHVWFDCSGSVEGI